MIPSRLYPPPPQPTIWPIGPRSCLLSSDPGVEDVVPIPDDNTPDEAIGPALATRRALEWYPTTSPITEAVSPTLRTVFTQDAQRRFKRTLDELDPRIRAKMEQPFGKDNISQHFTSEASLRHVLVPLWKSGHLAGSHRDWASLCEAYYPAKILRGVLEDLGDVPFSGIRGYNPDWETETELNQDRIRMASAALLHFNGSVADLVRWIGGPHVGAHRDLEGTFQALDEAQVDPKVISDLKRIFTDGIPARCTASSTERNFEAFYRYGNHSTVDEEPEKTYKAMVKDSRKGFILVFDQRMVLFILHCHLTPQGVVDLNSLFKNPRPIFDSSFRPYVWCYAINDWTHKDNEPPLTFASAEMGFMIWLYNLRITYPWLEIYIGDDDVSGAFRLMKYNPNCMSLHTSSQCGYCVVNTGGTFGDNTSPSNFDPIGMARRQLAWHMWSKDMDVVPRILPHLPPLRLAADPTPAEVDRFVQSDPDSMNSGVLHEDGSRKSPPYNMHVDDSLYADVGDHMIHTICVSVAALFRILGPPTNPLVPSPLSVDKFEGFYNHERKLVGRRFNSRTMSVGMLPYKRDQLLQMLSDWTSKTRFELAEIAQLLGVLENHTRYARWARCWYFSLQNAVRHALEARYHIVARIYEKSGRALQHTRALPPALASRLSVLVARDKAHLLWSSRQRFAVGDDMKASLSFLLHYVQSEDSPWEVPLGLIVPRVPHFWSRGDASHLGGGAYCPGLKFWFDIAWSPRVLRGTRFSSSAPGYVHINSLEFIVVILQLAAVLTRIWDLPVGERSIYFPNGRPHIPVWLGETDNTVSKSWENRATAKTSQGQGLVAIYSEMLRTRTVHTMCDHLAGSLNDVADAISRNDFSLSLSARTAQLFQKHPTLRSCDYFLPSPELLQLVTLRLFSKRNPVPCELPEVLGQFLPAGSTFSTSATL